MQQKKIVPIQKLDYVTVLIIAFFLALTFGVFLYYKHRIKEIEGQLNKSSSIHAKALISKKLVG